MVALLHTPSAAIHSTKFYRIWISLVNRMKAIITAAGLGKRSGLNGLVRKELLNVYDIREKNLVLRPIMDVIINKLNRIGIDRIAVVLDPSDSLSQDYLKGVYPSVNVYFQREKNGFGDAVLSARKFVEDEGFLLAAGDGMVLDMERFGAQLKEAERSGEWKLFVMKVEDPRRYGVAVLKNGNRLDEVVGVVEKPNVPPSSYALCALYYLPPQIFDFISYKNGKAELTGAIDDAIRSGLKFGAIEIPSASWVSVGRAEDYRTVLEATYQHSKKSLELSNGSDP